MRVMALAGAGEDPQQEGVLAGQRFKAILTTDRSTQGLVKRGKSRPPPVSTPVKRSGVLNPTAPELR